MVKREISLRERALAMLARREHTRAEMTRKLSPHSESPEQVEQLLDALVRARLAVGGAFRRVPRQRAGAQIRQPQNRARL